MALVDTDVLVDVLREHPPAVRWLNGLSENPLMPGFVAMELYEGCRNKAEVERVSRLIVEFTIVWPSPDALWHALLDYPGRHLHCNVGIVDSLVAACALDYREPLLTFNTKHFSAVEGLVVEEPYER
jgi:predicted nucleic acid-binding protein